MNANLVLVMVHSCNNDHRGHLKGARSVEHALMLHELGLISYRQVVEATWLELGSASDT
jgi:hypothetical protein